MVESDPSVQRFVETYIREGDDTVELPELWDLYGPRSTGVPRERFKKHLIEALPEELDYDREGDTFHGIKIELKEERWSP